MIPVCNNKLIKNEKFAVISEAASINPLPTDNKDHCFSDTVHILQILRHFE